MSRIVTFPSVVTGARSSLAAPPVALWDGRRAHRGWQTKAGLGGMAGVGRARQND